MSWKKIINTSKPCKKHKRSNCPDPECNPYGTAVDQIIRDTEHKVKDLKPVKNEKKDK